MNGNFNCIRLNDKQKVFGAGVSLLAGASGIITLSFPGIFCPELLVITQADTTIINEIKVGNHVLVFGPVSAMLFGGMPGCCLQLHWPCACKPGVNIVLDVTNDSASPETINASIVGEYCEVCK